MSPPPCVCGVSLLEGVPDGGPPDGTGTFVAVGTHRQPYTRLLGIVTEGIRRGSYRSRCAEDELTAAEVEAAQGPVDVPPELSERPTAPQVLRRELAGILGG